MKDIYPELNYPHVTELDLLMAELIYPILVELAPTGETITYKGVVKKVQDTYPGIPEVKSLHHRHIGRRLGTIWRFTEKYGCPHIGALVINQDTGECGRSITEHLDPEIERVKIKNFDWSSVDIGFSQHLKRTKAANIAKKQKLKKRKYDEAKNIFFEFWRAVKEEVPVASENIKTYRNELIATVQEGYSPATALSNILKRLLSENKIKKEPSSGYVYIGEYKSNETNEPLFNYVKIGYTTCDVAQRAQSLSGGVISPLKFEMKHVWKFDPGFAFIAEQYLHGFFDSYREMGEFFDSMDGLLEEWAEEVITSEYSDISEKLVIDSNV
ncbi:GIY-YIG nuclease family protein [Pseudoalteromonas sp. OF7H-1]|uniref:GIY-YIG nuclease family protein n=1 Tax=Pseudoalteromonas sp. OF7H-1 TaxID=2917755 RepID=UPI001EF6218F|nr:GIY-YIG nuclease family protein [Pseudoalteromonas sp. OF7H-1]MCG7538245.1 GIY-YIG nuclease family protein [Pseudoalteromonas sp. OF7H-1]